MEFELNDDNMNDNMNVYNNNTHTQKKKEWEKSVAGRGRRFHIGEQSGGPQSHTKSNE